MVAVVLTAAAVTAATVVAVVTTTAAAADENDEDQDPAAVTAHTVIAAHMKYLHGIRFLCSGVAAGHILSYAAKGKGCRGKEKVCKAKKLFRSKRCLRCKVV